MAGQAEVKLLHIEERQRSNASSAGENEARLTAYEARLTPHEAARCAVKRSLTASCFLPFRAKKMVGVVFIVRKSSPASKKLETTANC